MRLRNRLCVILGPLRPAHHERRIRLVFARPELMRRTRFHLPWTTNMITTQFDVHPWPLADAIRWYAEHPQHRAAIGTQAEHDRLVAAVGLTAGEQPLATEPPPRDVRTAIRLSYAGVAFGLLFSSLDVALLFIFADRLKAHAVAVGQAEMLEYGLEPDDWESGVFFDQAFSVGVLALAAIAAMAALMSIRFLARGNQAGRFGLIAVSGAAALWALTLCFDIAATDPPPDLLPLLLTVAAVKRLSYLGLGVATLLLLLSPSAQVFTQPDRPPV